MRVGLDLTRSELISEFERLIGALDYIALGWACNCLHPVRERCSCERDYARKAMKGGVRK
jgi:hypothetical protein